jgi:hypothetical protein
MKSRIVGMLGLVAFLSMSMISCVKSTKLNSKQLITKQEAIDALMAFDEGWRNKLATTVDSVLSPTYVYFTPSGGTFSRDSIVTTAAAAYYTLEFMNRSFIDITLEGNTATVNTRWMGKGQYRGEAFDDVQRCSVILIKENGKVKILSEHCSEIKEYTFR